MRATERLDGGFGHRSRILDRRRQHCAVVRHQVDLNAAVLVSFARFGSLALLGVGRTALARSGIGGLVRTDDVHLDTGDVDLTAGTRSTA